MCSTSRIPDPPQIYTWYLRIQGGCTEISRIVNYAKTPNIEKRGQVGAFTNAARMRMLRLIAKIDWQTIGKSLLVTLTYPDGVGETTYKERSKHRYLFMRYAEKSIGRHVPSIWRVEWKARQTGQNVGKVFPHMHMILCGVGFWDQREVRDRWRTIVHVNGPLCTDVQSIEGENGAQAYVAKYASKSSTLDIDAYHNKGRDIGRHWGITRKSLIPMLPLRILRVLTDEQAEELKLQAAVEFPHYDPLLGGGFTFLGKVHAECIASKFERTS